MSYDKLMLVFQKIALKNLQKSRLIKAQYPLMMTRSWLDWSRWTYCFCSFAWPIRQLLIENPI